MLNYCSHVIWHLPTLCHFSKLCVALICCAATARRLCAMLMGIIVIMTSTSILLHYASFAHCRFSFVKSSQKYYDDSSCILGNMIMRRLAPTLKIPWSPPYQIGNLHYLACPMFLLHNFFGEIEVLLMSVARLINNRNE